MGTFKDLEIFQSSVTLVKKVYQVTSDIPEEEKFTLAGQIRRAAISIPSKIAESTGRRTATEHRHFLDIATGSLNEIQTQFIIAYELNYIDQDALTELENYFDALRPRIFAFYRSIKDRPPISTTSNP